MKKRIKKLKENYKLIICWIFIILAILLFIIVKVICPKEKETINLYEEEEKQEKIYVTKLTQYIYPQQQEIEAFRIYFDDYSIDECDFFIQIFDEDDTKYLEQKVTDYTQNQLYLYIGNVKNAINKKFKMTIETDNCSGFKTNVIKSEKKEMHLKNNKEKTLKISVDCFKKNNKYNWYSILLIFIALLLFPLARRKNEKK